MTANRRVTVVAALILSGCAARRHLAEHRFADAARQVHEQAAEIGQLELTLRQIVNKHRIDTWTNAKLSAESVLRTCLEEHNGQRDQCREFQELLDTATRRLTEAQSTDSGVRQ